jgi:hypothetical protein
LPLRVKLSSAEKGFSSAKNPSPSIAMSRMRPVCSTGPSAKSWVIAETVAPIPAVRRGSVGAPLATRSENCAELFLNPTVSALAMLWAMTRS